jgi:hypothetical protein
MKLRIIFFSLFLSLATQLSITQNSIQQNKIFSPYSNESEYTYVDVFENGSWWIYVYDGTILIDRYLLED